MNEYKDITGLSSTLQMSSDYSYFKNLDFDINNKISCEVNATTITDEITLWNSFNSEIKILKIDTQGTELNILENATNYFKDGYIDVVMIEIMVVNKYIGQDNYLNLITFFDNCNFEIYNINPIYREHKNKFVGADGFSYGWATEYDFTFVHKNAIKKVGLNED